MTGFLCALPLIARLAACTTPDVLAVGYVEGEYVNLAAVSSATLIEVGPRQGDLVKAGQIVARQERSDAEIALAEAEAARDQAKAEVDNLREGSRPEEIAVTEASLDAATVRLREAERQVTRQTALAERGVVPQAELDTTLAIRDTALTDVAQIEAELAVKRLPARVQVVAAAESRLAGTEAAVRNARWRLDQRDLVAPAHGRITDVFRRAGEIAGPTAPVLSLLPDGAFKVVAFVGEAEISGIVVGDRLEVRCDGCPPGQVATVSYVSDEPEFTPPVIFSVDNRQKLVYRIEARPVEDSRSIRPGQIVDVALSR